MTSSHIEREEKSLLIEKNPFFGEGGSIFPYSPRTRWESRSGTMWYGAWVNEQESGGPWKREEKKNNKERERRGNEDKRAPIQGTSFGWDGYIRMHLRPHLASHLSIHPSPYYERRKEKKEGSSSPLAPPSFSDSRKTRMKTGGERATRNLRDKLIHHPQPKVKTTSAGVEWTLV